MKILALLITPLALTLAACGSKAEPSTDTNANAQTSSPAATIDLATGAEFFKNTCTPCHGATGRGDGPASASFDPNPRDLSDSAWQLSIDDEYLSTIIKYGGASVGKSTAMPANPILNSDPDTLQSLVAHIRTLKE